ncbi:MAG: Mur ligase family protein [Dehalococcoidia bacterium]|nr:Mur ligase family protein [Dehalococcoidia bacterium]
MPTGSALPTTAGERAAPVGIRLRTVAAVLAGKAAGSLARRLGRGGGTALPGLLAERIEPQVVRRLAGQIRGPRVLVTGTNGKTTTSRLLVSILRAARHDPIRNGAGSNLMRGIAATLLREADLRGGLAPERPAVLEIDEATLLMAVGELHPDVIVFTNLFRDQLDRYGEIDAVAEVWRTTLGLLPAEATVVLNADDPLVCGLQEGTRARILTYGIDDPSVAGAAEHAADSRWCPRCGRDYAYDALYFGHIGLWRCPGCGDSRPTPDATATSIDLSDDAARFTLTLPEGKRTIELPLVGLYNVANALAAAGAALAMGLAGEYVGAGLAAATPAFGRQERLNVNGREVRLLLGKNPAGLNQALHTIVAAKGEKNLVFLLNDDIADGTDVSWIWDVDYEMLAGRARTVIAGGQRAEDMALRLKYAGLPPALVTHDIAAALQGGLLRSGEGEPLYVLPTYTAMLEARESLGRWASAGHYWERDDGI